MSRIITIITSFIFFILSLFQECFTVNGKDSIGSYGLTAFLLGIFNISESFIAWLANPLYFITIFLIIFNKRIAFITSILTFILALSFLILNNIIINEAGTIDKVDNYLIGYWLWLCCMTIPMIGIIISKVTPATNQSSIPSESRAMKLR